MRVGILTYHFVYNEGAVWQTYCLLNAIRKLAPWIKVEVVNYLEPGLVDTARCFPDVHIRAFADLQRTLVTSDLATDNDLQEFDAILV